MSDDAPDFGARMRRVEALVADLERRGGEAADAARELLGAVLDVHQSGLARVLAIAGQHGEPGRALIAGLAADADVASLLLLHDLHPAPLEARVRGALDGIASALEHGGSRIDALEIAGGGVRVVIARTPNGSAAKTLVEEALLAAAPDAERIEVEEIVASALLPVARLTERRAGGEREEAS